MTVYNNIYRYFYALHFFELLYQLMFNICDASIFQAKNENNANRNIYIDSCVSHYFHQIHGHFSSVN